MESLPDFQCYKFTSLYVHSTHDVTIARYVTPGFCRGINWYMYKVLCVVYIYMLLLLHIFILPSMIRLHNYKYHLID